MNITVVEMLARMDAIANENSKDDRKQVEELNKYFEEVVIEELKNVHKATLAIRI